MKSHNDLLCLAIEIFKDFNALATYSSFQRDIKTLISRFENEGLSFLTISLPSFGDGIFQSLEKGKIDSKLFRGFKKSQSIPAFLQGMTSLVFDKSTGNVLDEPDIGAIKHIRQLTYMFKKLKMSCTQRRNSNAIKTFIQDEADLCVQPNSENLKNFSDICRILWDPYIANINIWDDLHPSINNCKHGPGATADGYAGNQKFACMVYHERLEQYFPYLGCFNPLNACSDDNITSKGFQNVIFREASKEQPVKITLVPKTLKSPRIIAIEPTCMQYAQQGLSHIIINMIKTNPITKGHINFDDQTINQKLALDNSKSKLFATLDLSSASDRVPSNMALAMFASNDDLQSALDASRSRRAKLPNGDILSLNKFASMGSAVCFPVEAMYFYTLCIMAQLEYRHLPVTYRNVYNASRCVYVYGDDIIVPVDGVATTIETLHKYHCKVGTSKSFWKCYFRESCGVDAWDGTEITPVYVRSLAPSSRRRDPEKIISWIATSNQLYKSGYWRSADLMSAICERYVERLPIVGNDSSAIGKTSFQSMVSIHRWGKRYHRPEVRALVAEAVYRKDPINNYHALAKSLKSLERIGKTIQINDKKHLERSARHGAARLRYQWVSPY